MRWKSGLLFSNTADHGGSALKSARIAASGGRVRPRSTQRTDLTHLRAAGVRGGGVSKGSSASRSLARTAAAALGRRARGDARRHGTRGRRRSRHRRLLGGTRFGDRRRNHRGLGAGAAAASSAAARLRHGGRLRCLWRLPQRLNDHRRRRGRRRRWRRGRLHLRLTALDLRDPSGCGTRQPIRGGRHGDAARERQQRDPDDHVAFGHVGAVAGAGVRRPDPIRRPVRRSKLRRSMIRAVGPSQKAVGIAPTLVPPASAPTTCMRNDSRPRNTMLACPVSEDSFTTLPPLPLAL